MLAPHAVINPSRCPQYALKYIDEKGEPLSCPAQHKVLRCPFLRDGSDCRRRVCLLPLVPILWRRGGPDTLDMVRLMPPDYEPTMLGCPARPASHPIQPPLRFCSERSSAG